MNAWLFLLTAAMVGTRLTAKPAVSVAWGVDTAYTLFVGAAVGWFLAKRTWKPLALAVFLVAAEVLAAVYL